MSTTRKTELSTMDSEYNGLNRHAFDSMIFARPLHRALAFIADGAIVALFVFLLTLNSKRGEPFVFASSWLAGMCLWEAVWLSFLGSTPGRKLYNLQIYSPRNDGLPDPQQVGLRILGYWVGLICLGMGLTPILFRRDRRGWADTLSDTIVVGKTSRAPSTFDQRYGQHLFLGQLIVVASLSVSFFVSKASKDFALPTNAASFDSGASRTCTDPRHLLSATRETLLALALSPVWADCWERNQFSLHTITDSQLYWAAKLAKLHFDLSTRSHQQADGELVRQIFEIDSTLCRATRYETCLVNRSVATDAPHGRKVSPALAYWLGPDSQALLEGILNAPSRVDRLKLLADANRESTAPLVKRAIDERIWAENAYLKNEPLALGVPSERFEEWMETQNCWFSVLKSDSGKTCSNSYFQTAMSVLNSFKTTKMTASENEYYLADFEDKDLPEDFTIALEMSQAAQEKNLPKLEKLYLSFSELSPLYSWATDLAGSVSK